MRHVGVGLVRVRVCTCVWGLWCAHEHKGDPVTSNTAARCTNTYIQLGRELANVHQVAAEGGLGQKQALGQLVPLAAVHVVPHVRLPRAQALAHQVVLEEAPAQYKQKPPRMTRYVQVRHIDDRVVMPRGNGGASAERCVGIEKTGGGYGTWRR